VRPNRLRLGAIAAWLGVIALSLDALVPIHLAFDLAHALETAAHRGGSSAAERDFSERLLTLVTGHHDEDTASGGKTSSPDKHHHPDCAVCSSLGTLAGFAPAAIVPPSIPIRVEAPILLAAIASEPPAAPATAYRSRAPPIATADLNT
jgi:Protein of unknown function (DUF2946)